MSPAGEFCIELVNAFWANAQMLVVGTALVLATAGLAVWRFKTRHQKYEQQRKG